MSEITERMTKAIIAADPRRHTPNPLAWSEAEALTDTVMPIVEAARDEAVKAALLQAREAIDSIDHDYGDMPANKAAAFVAIEACVLIDCLIKLTSAAADEAQDKPHGVEHSDPYCVTHCRPGIKHSQCGCTCDHRSLAPVLGVEVTT